MISFAVTEIFVVQVSPDKRQIRGVSFFEADGGRLAGWASGVGTCSHSPPQVLVVSFS